MKIVFANNYLNHHERFLSEALYHTPGVEFYFIQTMEISAERVAMGWQDMHDAPFCICSYKNSETHKYSLKLCFEADALILGGAPNEFFQERVKANKLTFFYCERLFRNGVWHMLNPRTFFSVLDRFILPGQKSNVHMLCASAYTALDCHKIFSFRGRYYKWGHFIDVVNPSAREYCSENGKIRLLWAGRFLKLKHPDYPIRIAHTLKEKNISFVLDIIGSGEQEPKMEKMIKDYHLEDDIVLHGIMNPAEVRNYMEKADIYMFTSDFNEGWGAVLGESMSAGCAVVTSHGIGATPFLVQHQENGLIYETGNFGSFERNVLKLVASKELRNMLSRNAITTMQTLWSPLVAAERFCHFVKEYLRTGRMLIYDQGPLSKAELLSNNWFSDDTI